MKLGELLLFDTGYKGIALSLSKAETCILLLTKPLNMMSLTPSTKIWPTNQPFKVPVGYKLLGSVVDPLGTVLKSTDAFSVSPSMKIPYRRIETPSPSIIMRQSVNNPVLTGILVVDNLVPIGRGQRELIIGDRKTGKTSVAVDTIINQNTSTGVNYCIYVNIGQRSVTIGEIRQILEEAGALSYTIIVNAAADSGAALQYIAPFVGTTQAEYFMYAGHACLIIYDDLSKHAQAYRELSLILRRPPGREAYPGDIFYLHSRLLERSAKLTSFLGGGSITALPIIETQANDVSAYIPTNVISITDGQIYLSPSLFNKGVRPALNVGLSVSRVGSAAQPSQIKKLVGTLKIGLAQFIELQSFSQFASELDEATTMILNRGERLQRALTQRQGRPYHLTQSYMRTYVTVSTFLDTIEPSSVLRVIDYVNYLYMHITLLFFIELIDFLYQDSNQIKNWLLNIFNRNFRHDLRHIVYGMGLRLFENASEETRVSDRGTYLANILKQTFPYIDLYLQKESDRVRLEKEASDKRRKEMMEEKQLRAEIRKAKLEAKQKRTQDKALVSS